MNPLSKRRSKEIASLTQKKYRDRLGQTLVEGVRLIESALAAKAPLLDVVVTTEALADERVQALLRQTDLPVYTCTPREMDSLSEVQASQGLLATVRMEKKATETLSDHPTIIALDGVQDPGNVGTVIRTAAWFGTAAILAGPGTVDLFHPKVLRASMGGFWEVSLVETEALAETLLALKRQGFQVYGADLKGSSSRSWQPTWPSVLVLGSEAHGLSKEVKKLVDTSVVIPGNPTLRATESLNVAVASGILIYEWLKGKA